MKVYCGNCKHYQSWDCYGPNEHCKTGFGLKDNYFRQTEIHASPSERNGLNDCSYWSPNRRYRLRRWLERMWG